MKIRFSKMHGLGNDFVVIDGVRQSIRLNSEQIQFLANRHWGVGCDQLLLVEPSSMSGVDFRYRIFNADGGEVEQCGNGARCFARFVFDEGLTQKQCIRVETMRGVITPELTEDGLVTVNMGVPSFCLTEIPFDSVHAKKGINRYQYTIAVQNGEAHEEVTIFPVSMGNPHAVQVVSDVNVAPVAEQGALIERHPAFPQRVNAGFLSVKGVNAIDLRVFERGVGETQACGTGACAAAVSAITLGIVQSPVHVNMPGGSLVIEWGGEGTPVLMTGPAVTVFKGEIEL